MSDERPKIPLMVRPNPSYGYGDVSDFAPRAFEPTPQEIEEYKRATAEAAEEERLYPFERAVIDAAVSNRILQKQLKDFPLHELRHHGKEIFEAQSRFEKAVDALIRAV